MTIYSTSIESSTIIARTSQNGAIVVTSTGSLAATGGGNIAVVLDADYGSVVLDGTIYATSVAIDVTAAATRTVIGSTGILIGEVFAYRQYIGAGATDLTNFGSVYGQIFSGPGAGAFTLRNAGTITGASNPFNPSSPAINFGNGGSNTIANSGAILGAVQLSSGDERLDSSGKITGSISTGAGTDAITNTGTIQGAITFASLIGQLPTLANAGTIVGTVTGGAGSEKITNAGQIAGDVLTGAGADTITNSGEIVGSIETAGILGSAKANVLNTGHVTGSITTGNAADQIDTHLGTVGGALYGGKGDDTYTIAGAERIGEIASSTGGFDTVLSYGDHQLGIGLEALSLFGAARLGIGNALNNYLTANTLGSTLIGGAGNDFLFGEDGDDTLRGGVGDDTIYEQEGQNTIYGGAGDDTVYLSGGESLVYGGNGADTLSAATGDNLLNGGNGADTLVSGEGADYLFGDAGFDTGSYANSTSGVTVSLDLGTGSGGYAEGDLLSGVENLIGSAFADQLTGTIGANRLDGGGGGDTLIGGEGDDVLTGGAGGDVVNGGEGFDIADYSTAIGAIVLNGATVSGDIVGDSFNSIEGFTLSGFDDTFVAVYDLSLFIDGGAGNDTIACKGAADRLDGDTGNDTLTGGGGADIFQFDRFFGANFQLFGWGKDTITDFQDGVDRIDLSHAIGIHDFSDLTITHPRAGTLVAYGNDSILLSGVAMANITAADFIFG